jgi:hypothetical protein
VRPVSLAAVSAIAACGLACGWLLGEAPTQGSGAASARVAPAERDQVAAPLQATRVESSAALELDATTATFLEAFAQRGAALEREGASRESAAALLSQAREGQLSPGDLRQALEEQLRAGAAPGGVARLLVDALGGEDEDVLAFAVSQALSRHLDGAATRVLIEGLPRAPYAAMALRGSNHPRVAPALAARYRDAEAGPLARALSGFVLADARRLEQLEPAEQAAVRERARGDLLDAQPQLQSTAADLLGAAPLGAQERAWLEGVVTTGQGASRLQALRALATSGLSPADLRATLERAAGDPSEPALQALAQRLLSGE